VIPARYEHVPIRRTHGKYRKQMKRGIPGMLYYQRNKNETLMSVIKRIFGEYVASRLVRTQNREISFRCIAYNMHRLTNLVIIMMVSTYPIKTRKRYTFLSTYSPNSAYAATKKKMASITLQHLIIISLSLAFGLLAAK
jgi:hypothetical protein